MFALRTHKAINITTFEVDVRLDLAMDNLEIEGKCFHALFFQLLRNDSSRLNIAFRSVVPKCTRFRETTSV